MSHTTDITPKLWGRMDLWPLITKATLYRDVFIFISISALIIKWGTGCRPYIESASKQNHSFILLVLSCSVIIFQYTMSDLHSASTLLVCTVYHAQLLRHRNLWECRHLFHKSFGPHFQRTNYKANDLWSKWEREQPKPLLNIV